MSQIFHPSTNIWSKVSIIVGVVFIGFLAWVVVSLSWSGYVTGQGVTVDQPIQFSHAHHVGSMGIDCRYCHTSVEESAFAKISTSGPRAKSSTWRTSGQRTTPASVSGS
jgi:hypothetical protein